MPLRRPSTSDGQSVASSSPSSSLGTKRRFPLLGRKKNRNSELIRPSTGIPLSFSSSTSKLKKPGLRVHVQIKFESPLSQEHVRDYEASPQLVASDRLCQALLSRLQHCSAELITRHDCSALDPLRKPHRDVKPLRYRITYRVERDGLTLVEKSLRSFQEYAPTADDAREVLSAIDRIVGLFLVRHDPGFKWPEPPEAEPVNYDSETVRPCTGRPQSTCCIPRSRFVHSTQAFELVPGYTIELFLRSRCATRYPENRNASIKIDSRQPTPLTLLLGEELTTRVSNLLIDPIDSWKRKFDKRHRNCNGFEGSGGCAHVEDGAVDVMVKVRNNLGPDYNYFSHRIQTSKVLFNDPNGRDFDEFANSVKAKLEKARDMSDKSLRSMDDLTLRIRELRGRNWSVHEPLTIRLDSSVTYCRQTVEAIMERLQSGISNVLESHEDALATMTVHKRGHLIFDGFLDGAGGDDSTPPEKYSSPDVERRALESKLKDRIRADITMLCKDTCSLDCSDYLSNLKIRASGASAGPRDNTQPQNIPRPPSERSIPESSSVRSDHTLAKKQAQPNLREPSLAPSSPASLPPTELQRVPSGVEMAKKYGYMADFIADEEHQSEPPSTPSLVDTDSISPRDSIVVTPQSARGIPQDQSNEGLRIIDDGRRIIYQEQSDADAIAQGVTEFHRYEEVEPIEPIQLVKDPAPETPERRATRRSLDTRMPDLSGSADPVTAKSTPPVSLQKEEKLQEPAVIEPAKSIKPEAPAVKPVEESTAPVVAPVTTAKPEEPVKVADASVKAPEPAQTEIIPEKNAPTEAPAATTVEKSESAHEEQWEMVEASTSALIPQQVEANSKSETSVGSSTSPSISEDVVKPVEEPATPAKQPEEKVLEPVVPKEAPKEAPAIAVAPVASAENATEEAKVDTIIKDFPEPPHTPLEVKTEFDSNLEKPEVQSPTRAPPPIPTVEDSTLQPEAIRSSSDSGISMEDQPREQVAKEEAPAKEIAKEQEIKSDAKADEPTAKKPEVPAIADIGESLPTKEFSIPVEDRIKYMISEDMEYQSTSVLSLASSPMLEPVPEDAAEEEFDIPKKFTLNHDTPVPTPPSPPTEKLLTPEERSNLLSSLEELPEPPRFERADLPPVLARPRTNTLPSRRYSTALTLEIDTERPGPEWASQNVSPIDAPPKSAIFPGRQPFRHRRQPSAGLLGLREQRMHEVGLRNALVPYRWRGLRADQEWGSRPGTSYSEQ